ncbi:MAG: nickel pincer cofactor biosynthesis protein LarC [Promethearchaeota archaeon]|nr:MAG: nickel pincer cofactor biosynthesis protein LarC [Candidatus Lokiarchaeota archaeon]
MRILHIDLKNSGISGDMFLAGLLGLVPDPNKILLELRNLKNFFPDVSKLNLKLINVERSGIQLNQLDIGIEESKDHRTAKTLQKYLNDFLFNAKVSDPAMNYANNVLNSLIQAEVEVHGVLFNKIHLHELSSIDTLIDIIGVTMAIDSINGFNNDLTITCSKLPLGSGTVNISHGTLTIPAPATLKILEKSDLSIYGGPIDSELTTPTGVALLSNLKPSVLHYIPEMKIFKSVYSTGQKRFKNFLNIMRIFYGEFNEKELVNFDHHLQKYIEQVAVLETDVDDVSGEIIGHFISLLEKEDILDIQVFPSITKKNRPSYYIKVLCYPEQVFNLIEKIIINLGTLGVRFNIINRVCINRRIEKEKIEINEKFYEISFKISFIESDKGSEIVYIKPEYEDLKKISEHTGISIKKLELIVQTKLRNIYNNF